MTSSGIIASEAVRELLERAASEQAASPGVARQLALQARVVARAEADRVGEAEALYRLASLAHANGQPDDAFRMALEASEIAAEHGHRVLEAWAVHLLGVVHYQASSFGAALDRCQRALELYQASTDGVDAGNMLNTIAAIYHSMGDTERAIATYEQALAAAEPYGRSDLVALVLGNIARIRASRSEYLAAVSMGRRAVAMARDHQPSIVTSLLADLGESYMGLADHARAAQCFREARQILIERSEQGDEPPASAHLGVIVAEGRVAIRRGALDEAIAVLQAALDLSQRTGSREYELEIDELLATAFKRTGRFEEALEARERHDELRRELLTHAGELRVRTIEVASATTIARLQGEIVRLRDAGRQDDVDASSFDVHTLEAFQQLAMLMEFRDSENGEHTGRVGDLAAEMAHALGEPPEWCEQLRMAARLHDVGKVAVPDSVLTKTGALTVEEYELMKAHTSMGHRILAATSTPMFQTAAEIAQSHHEWWDGGGYPLGIGGTSIALSGRIVAVADVFDALCSERPYKRGWARAEAARFVVSGAGVQFDPQVVAAFVTVMRARDPELGL